MLMTSAIVYALAAIALIGAGVFGLIAGCTLIGRIVALNVASVGVLALMVAFAARGVLADPVTHAMVLTGLVVAFSATALALAIVRRLREITAEASEE